MCFFELSNVKSVVLEGWVIQQSRYCGVLIFHKNTRDLYAKPTPSMCNGAKLSQRCWVDSCASCNIKARFLECLVDSCRLGCQKWQFVAIAIPSGNNKTALKTLSAQLGSDDWNVLHLLNMNVSRPKKDQTKRLYWLWRFPKLLW